jgi:hypothetical protein
MKDPENQLKIANSKKNKTFDPINLTPFKMKDQSNQIPEEVFP